MLWREAGADMAFNLSEHDHRRLDRMIDDFLETYKRGDLSLEQVRSGIAHVFTAAMIDNENEVLSWLKPETRDYWKRDIDASRT
jgi:hypothetical protein